MAAWLGRVSLGDAWYNMYSRLLRTKPVGSMAHGSDDLTELAEGSAVGLAKVLTTVDLVSLGVGSCVGTGMYVVAGLVAKAMAGPGVILSFIIAAVASILSGKRPRGGRWWEYSDFSALLILSFCPVQYFIPAQVMQGAATCFYAFIGFDIIATTGEEAKNPNTSIPYAITASLVTCLTAYVSVSVILTLMVPYNLIDGSAPLMEMFAVHGFMVGKYIVAVGSIAGLTVSLLGSLFPMPRVIYAMSRDGLLFRFLSHVSALTHTPAVACVVSGTMAAVLALLVSLRDLIEMMSIGTLLAYTLVSVCVLLLRYQPDEHIDTLQYDSEVDVDGLKQQDGENVPTKDDQILIGGSDNDGSSSYHAGATEGEGDDSDFHTGHASLLKRLLGGHYYTLRLRLGMPDASARPTPASGRIVTRCTLLLFFTSFFLWSTVIFGVEQGSGVGAVFSGLMATLMAASLVKLLVLIIQQPESQRRLPYMAPCVPFVPAAAILVNSYLMLKLSPLTWARFTIWCLIGLLIYGCYGVWHSTLELDAREQQAHASSYQRYDDHLDDTFSPDDDLYPQDRRTARSRRTSDPRPGGRRWGTRRQEQRSEQFICSVSEFINCPSVQRL
uniref:Solute carrier family 7 member 14b n=1 Tax=Acanthochromis polyacanthus TaxID=80966 RepID=A0A3Q1EB86_9TELE